MHPHTKEEESLDDDNACVRSHATHTVGFHQPLHVPVSHLSIMCVWAAEEER